MKQKQTLNYMEKFLSGNDEIDFELPQRLDKIIETTEKEIWNQEPLAVKVFSMRGTLDNKTGYQNIIKINDKEIYITEISNKQPLIYFCDHNLFLVDDKVTCIPLHYILMSLLKENPYNTICNALNKIKMEESVIDVIMNRDERDSISFNLIKYQNKLNDHLFQERLYTIAEWFVTASFLMSALNDFKGIATIGCISLSTLLFRIYNRNCILKCVKMNQNDLTTLTEYSLILENVVNYINNRDFKIPNEFSMIKEKNDNMLLQNDYLRLYTSNTRGYINDELLNQTSLFINNIELWHGDYEKENIPIVAFDNCIYILKDEGIIIPYHYILESIYEDNPVDSINQLLENDKVKKLKR